jgi:nickel transport protein
MKASDSCKIQVLRLKEKAIPAKRRNRFSRRGMRMNKYRLKMAVAVLIFTCFAFLSTNSAFAHRVSVFAWVDGDKIYLESKFAGGRPVKSGKVVVTDPKGVELLTGTTNDAGEYSFKIPQRTDLKIVLIAGQGHQAEWTVRKSEMEDISPAETSGAGTEKAGTAEKTNTAIKNPVAEAPSSSGPDIRPDELEALIGSVLDRKLKPITRMLADLQQEDPSIKDIFAGIGYIFGLVGVAAYVQSRKKRQDSKHR